MTFRMFLAGTAMTISALAITGCSGGGSPDAPAIEPFLWTDKPAYCAFLPEETEFEFSDKTTWKFVFVTDPQAGPPLEASPAFMQIAGQQVKLMRDLEAPGAGGQTWVYRSEDGLYEVELQLEDGAREAGAATGGPTVGKMRLLAPEKGKPQVIRGGCGL